MKKDIIISIGYGLLLLSIINAVLCIRESPLLEYVNIDIMMTLLSIYVFFINISQILYKKALRGEKELKNNPNIDPIEKNKRESAISRQTTFARYCVIGSVVVTILFMILLTASRFKT